MKDRDATKKEFESYAKSVAAGILTAETYIEAKYLYPLAAGIVAATSSICKSLGVPYKQFWNILQQARRDFLEVEECTTRNLLMTCGQQSKTRH